MSKDRLTKEEALKLIPSVVDDEVDEAVKTAFYKYIDSDIEVRRKFESIKKIKELVAGRCPRHKAPEQLKVRIQKFIFEETQKEQFVFGHVEELNPKVDRPSRISTEAADGDRAIPGKNHNTQSTSLNWIYAAAASFLLLAVLWGFFYTDNTTSPSDANTTYRVEEYVYKHFEDNDGKLVPPNISTASLSDAEISLSSNYNMSLKVPSLKDAEFKGVAYSEFVPDFKTPLLEYYLPGEDQYIYIFAFPMDQLDQFGKLTRDREAVKNCVKPGDFHIENINGKHVVSWQWNGTWYAAISNHNGKILASLIESLQYEPEDED